VIVVLGRPGLDARGQIGRLAGRIALAAARAGGQVELVGSVGADEAGETVALELGRAGVGHAALLRDPGGQTPRSGEEGNLPRLDAADVDLGLHYLADCRVLVVAESVDAAALEVGVAAAEYHRAALIVVLEPGTAASALPDDATVLEAPAEDDSAFADLVGGYAARLHRGVAPADAWREAVTETGWSAGPT
jgi:hypothetical protein